MPIEQIEPSEFAQEMTRKLVEQNERIIEMNAILLRALATPMVYVEPQNDEL